MTPSRSESSGLDPRLLVSADLFARYERVINLEIANAPEKGPLNQRVSLLNLSWICRTAQEQIAQLPLDKISRWLGFIQACLAMRGLIDVDVERDFSRPLFHSAYSQLGYEMPAILQCNDLSHPQTNSPREPYE